ncbi:MAG TPA: hypothetical protein VF607_01410, partial [Verrucomicrobiae bacterium]
RNVFAGLALLATAGLLHAQTALVGSLNSDLGPVQPAQPDSIVQITVEAEGLTAVDPATLPLFAACWWTVYPDSGPVPMPIAPADLTVPIYEIGDGIYLVDETGGTVSLGSAQANNTQAVAAFVGKQGNQIADLIEEVQNTEFVRMTAMAFGMDVPSPGGGDDSGGSGVRRRVHRRPSLTMEPIYLLPKLPLPTVTLPASAQIQSRWNMKFSHVPICCNPTGNRKVSLSARKARTGRH